MSPASYFPGGPDRPTNTDPLTDAAEVAAIRQLEGYAAYLDRACGGLRARSLEFVTAPGADPDYLTPQELYGTDDPVELARIRDGELEDYERWGADPFGGE